MHLDLEYAVSSPTYCVMQLQRLKPKEDDDSGVEVFTVHYHADSKVPDFVVLASKVKRSLNKTWSPEEIFKMYYLDSQMWYQGHITEVSPKDERYPDSPWEILKVKWDNDEFESTRLNPWELEECNQEEIPAMESLDDEGKQ